MISPLTIVIALPLLRFLSGENHRDLNPRPGKLPSDLLAALILSAVIIGANVLSNQFLSELLPDSASDTSARSLFVELANNPGLLVLFLALLMPLGALTRVDADTTRSIFKKRGTVMFTQIPAASSDGKTITISTKGTNALEMTVNGASLIRSSIASGYDSSSVAVYDRHLCRPSMLSP